MTVLAKYRLASEEIMEKIIEMTIKGVMNSAATIGMLPVLTDKIVDQGSRDRMYHPRTS
jgi:membrane-associated HD superfamily phosphohydrolase